MFPLVFFCIEDVSILYELIHQICIGIGDLSVFFLLADVMRPYEHHCQGRQKDDQSDDHSSQFMIVFRFYIQLPTPPLNILAL